MALGLKMTTKEMLEEKGYTEGIIVSDTGIMMRVRNNFRPNMGKFVLAQPWEVAKGNASPFLDPYIMMTKPYASVNNAYMQLAGYPTMGSMLRNTMRDIKNAGYNMVHSDKDTTKFMWDDAGECINFLRIGKGDVLIHGKAELDGADYKIQSIKELLSSEKDGKYNYYIIDPLEGNALSDGTKDSTDDIFDTFEFGDGSYRTYAIIYNGKYFGAVRTCEDGSLKMWYRPVNKKNDGELFTFERLASCSLFALPYILFNTVDGGEMEGIDGFKTNLPLINREVVICSGDTGCKIYNMPTVVKGITAKETAEFTGEDDYILAAFKHYAGIDKSKTEGEFGEMPVYKCERDRVYYLNAMYESSIKEYRDGYGHYINHFDIYGACHEKPWQVETQAISYDLYTNTSYDIEWNDKDFSEKATINIHCNSCCSMYDELLEVSYIDREKFLNELDADQTVNLIMRDKYTIPGYIIMYRLKNKEKEAEIRSYLASPLTGTQSNYNAIFRICEEINIEDDCELVLKVSILE